MGKHYRHLGLEERCQVAELHKAGCSIQQIAAALDRSPSSISRELKRNRGVQVGYKPTYAQEQAAARRWKGSRLGNAMPSCASLSWIASGAAGRPSRSPVGWPAARPRPASATRASTASSMTRSAARTTARGATTAQSQGQARPAAACQPLPVSLIKGRVSIASASRGRPAYDLRPLGGRPHAVHRPATPSWCRKNASPEPRCPPSSPARRPSCCRTPAQLVHRDRSATAQVDHLRQRHRVRPASPPGRSA